MTTVKLLLAILFGVGITLIVVLIVLATRAAHQRQRDRNTRVYNNVKN